MSGMGGPNYRPNMMNQRFGGSGMGMPQRMPGIPPNHPGMNPAGMDRMGNSGMNFMNSMGGSGGPPGPGNPMFNPNSFNPSQPSMTQPNPSPSPNQSQNQSLNNSGNAQDSAAEMGEILALIDSDGPPNAGSQVKNEPAQCGHCKQQVCNLMKYFLNIYSKFDFQIYRILTCMSIFQTAPTFWKNQKHQFPKINHVRDF